MSSNAFKLLIAAAGKKNTGTVPYLFSWGQNSYGQLGYASDGLALVPCSSPVQVGTSSWTAVAGGSYHTAAIRSDGALFTWGYNNFGQLGQNNITNLSSPIQVGTSSWTAVGAGYYHTAAIRSDGALFTWGYNSYGQLGQNTITNLSSPVQVGTSSWTAVVGGFYHTAAIRSDGALFTWGRNNFGQLGQNTITNLSSPVQVGTSSWTAVAGGYYHIAATRSGGALFMWGRNIFGQLGQNTTTNVSSPVQVGTSSWTAVVGGFYHTAAIRSNGALFTWGNNSYGQLGQNNITNLSSPIQVGTSSWTAVGAGYYHTAAIRSDGALFTWGRNNFGQLGQLEFATLQPVSSPVQVGTSSWTAVGAGYYHTAAIRSDRALFTWGYNNNGQLGQNIAFNINVSSPVQVGTSSWTAVVGGYYHTAAIRSDGALFTWGYNSYGQLGQNTITNLSSPVQVGTSSWTAVVGGYYHTAAIRSDGALFTWGNNSYGQLGQNNITNLSSPIQVGTSSWTAVGAGYYHTAAIRSDGALFTWGYNSYGQLGQNTITNLSSPVQVGTSSWTAVVGGFYHTAAIRSDGALFTWGRNNFGQLGQNTITNLSSPVQVGTSSWTAVAGGYYHTAAIRSDRALFTWGYNTYGQLGQNTIKNLSSPVQVGTSSWTAVVGGFYHTAAIRSDGALFTWGRNNNGQLGQNTIQYKSFQPCSSRNEFMDGSGWWVLSHRSDFVNRMHLIDQELELMLRGKFSDAWRLSQRLEKETPNDLRHKFNRAWFLLSHGDFQKGMQMLDCGRLINVYGGPLLNTNKPIWNGKDSLEGKTMIINLEGGYGDEMIHARFATDIAERGGKAILRCSDNLKDLLKRIKGVSSCINFSEVPITPHDYWAPGFSCGWLFGYTYKTLRNQPYLSAPDGSIEIWKTMMKLDKDDNRPRIGIKWSGNPKFEHQQFRIFPPEPLINLAGEHDEFKFYSLQKDNDTKELPSGVTDLQHFLLSWIDTAAAIQNLDLVITSCTSIAHLASAMGKPTWVILPILPYHIWAECKKHSSWYQKTTRTFRQKDFESWDDAFVDLEKELVKYFSKKTVKKTLSAT